MMKERKTFRKILSFILMITMLLSQTVQLYAQEETGGMQTQGEQNPTVLQGSGESAEDDPVTGDVSGGDVSGGDVSSGNASVSGSLWLDSYTDIANGIYDGNGVFDAGEQPLSGYPVRLYQESDLVNPVRTTTTDASGYYEFADLLPGTYVAGVKSETVDGVLYLLPFAGISGDNKFAMAAPDYTDAYTVSIVLEEETAVTGMDAGMRTMPDLAPMSGGYTVSGDLVGSYITLADAMADINSNSGSTYVIEATMSDSSMGNIVTINAGKNVTLKSSGSTAAVITQTIADERHFRVSGNLTLENIVLEGRNTGGGVRVTGGTLTMGNGAVVQNCRTTTSREGGGVYVLSGGAITMNSGSLIDNCGAITSGQSMGGGVSVTNSSTLTMNAGAVIQNCYVNSTGSNYTYGGGVSVNYGSTFHMYGGTIQNNTASSANGSNWTIGGGVFIGQSDTGSSVPSTFIMDGGTISGNTVSGATSNVLSGGGVGLMNGAVFTMNGGSISSNRVIKNDSNFNRDAFGGGVGIYSTESTSCQFVMNGGSITSNTVENNSSYPNYINAYGGGIGVLHHSTSTSASSIRITNGTINGNEAILGGGIYTNSKGTVQIDAGSVINNKAQNDGGGIYTTEFNYANPIVTGSYGNLTIGTSVAFSGNTASASYGPPSNGSDITNLQFAGTSTTSHILNNYDVNYRGAYNVIYEPNGGSGAQYIQAAGNAGNTTVAAQALSVTGITAPTGYTFKTWSTDATGLDTNQYYAPGDVFILSGNVTLYGIWEADFSGLTLNGVTTVYDANSHSVVLAGTLAGDIVEYYVGGVLQTSSPTFKDVGNYLVEVKVTRGTESETRNAYVSITTKAITITTNSASKVYDGNPLTAGGNVAGIEGAETYTFTLTGSQTNVGNSQNTYSLIWNGTAKDTNYYIQTESLGTLTVNLDTGNTIIVTANSGSKTYDGSPLTVNTYTYTGNLPGDTVYATTSGSQTNVGSSDNRVTNVWVEDANGNDVTANYQMGTHVPGTLSVSVDTNNVIVVTARSASKYYDGTALTEANYDLTGGTLATGHTVKAFTSGSQTNTGSSANIITHAWIEDGQGNDVSANYRFGTHLSGTLTVSADPSNVIVFKARDAAKSYDGTPLINHNYEVVSGTLGTGCVVYATYSGSQTNVGSSVNRITSLQIFDAYGMNVTSYYRIGTFQEGTLTVNKDTANPITVTAGSSNKVYDGTPLTNSTFTYTGTLASGHTVRATVSGSQTNVGNSANTVTSVWVEDSFGIDVSANYAFGTHVDGILAVNVDTTNRIILTANSDSKTYNGTALQNSDYTPTSGALRTGDTLVSVTTSGSQTNVGSSANTITSILIEDANGNDVTGNYAVGPHVDGVLTVIADPANIIEVTAKNATKLFDGSPLTSNDYDYTSTSGRPLPGHTLTIVGGGSQTYVGSSPNPVASLKIVDAANNDVTGNYLQGTHIAGTLTVQPNPNNILVVTAGSSTRAYDGTPLTNNTGTLTSGAIGPDHTLHVTTSGSQTNAGNSVNTVTSVEIRDVSGNDVTSNYSIGNHLTGTLTVEKAAVTVTTNSDSRTYNSQPLTAPGAITGLVNNETVTFSVTGSQTNAGSSTNTYSLIWNGTADPNNYKVETHLGTLEVTKAPLTVSTGDASKTYDGTPLTGPSGNYAGLQLGDTLTLLMTGSQTNAGSSENTYTIIWGPGTNGNNYEVIGTRGTLTVNRAAISVTTDSGSKTYDGTPLTVPTGTHSTLQNGETVTFNVTGSRTNAGSSSNTYSFVWNGSALEGNYTITESLGTLTVNTRALTISTGSATKAYDSTPLTQSSGSAAGLVSGETLIVRPNGSQTNVGSSQNTYAIAWGTANASNYHVASSQLGILTVTHGEVTVKANDTSKVYGTNDPAFTATVTGTYGSDTVSYTFSRTAGEDCSNYLIMPAGAQIQGNYRVTYAAGTLTIKPDPNNVITVISNDAVKEYDAASLSEAGYTYTGRLYGSDYLVASTSGSQVNVGTGDNIVTARIMRGTGAAAVDVTANYIVAYQYGGLTVTPRVAYVIANDCQKTYGDADPSFSATVTGLLGNDTVNYTLTREGGNNAGKYAIRVSNELAGNYRLTVISGTLTIKPREVVVYADYLIKAQGNADPYLSTTAVGLLGGDTLSYKVSRVPGEDVGIYKITIDGSSLQGGYAVTYKTGYMAITPDGTLKGLDPESLELFTSGRNYLQAIEEGIISPKTGADDYASAVKNVFMFSTALLFVLTVMNRKRRKNL